MTTVALGMLPLRILTVFRALQGWGWLPRAGQIFTVFGRREWSCR